MIYYADMKNKLKNEHVTVKNIVGASAHVVYGVFILCFTLFLERNNGFCGIFFFFLLF